MYTAVLRAFEWKIKKKKKIDKSIIEIKNDNRLTVNFDFIDNIYALLILDKCHEHFAIVAR